MNLFSPHNFKKKYIIIIIIIIIIITINYYNYYKFTLENTFEIEPQPVALDLENLSQYSSHSK